ncbi:hypothetical protein RHSIM_Rhsim13G0083100 [Rhododendron simsii]|uniref:ENTH domain-containing protein n=1 Tax=Rhododendron simsii TaxID=118357 RepID=A0A834G0C6_RHOSS|nr:hypothetical protein RHSIM_Rhsim13G0083100 [Rhododendron simsii]
MSTLGNNSGNMAAPSFHEFKKQASFFLKEKIKTARLALTDVTPAQLLTEEATNGNPRAPDTRTLKIISRAAFEVDDYWRIVEILHKGLAVFDRKNWRSSYNGLILLEHLLTHGPESVAEEFQSDRDVITEMGSFQHIDEKGFNWGLTVRKKSERILKLLEKGPLLKEERDRARKVTRGIEGFGSFCQRTASAEGVLRPSSFGAYGRCNSQFNGHGNEENQFPSSSNEDLTQTVPKKSDETHEENINLVSGKKVENSRSGNDFADAENLSSKENVAPEKEDIAEDFHEWSCTGESKSLLGDEKYDTASVSRQEEDHPFCETEHQSTHSLLSTTVQHMQAC